MLTLKKAIGLYDELYEQAQKIIVEHNPCQIEIGKTGKVSCIAVRGITDRSAWYYKVPDHGQLCCDKCKYLTKSGCGVKCLACKLYLCSNFSYKAIVKEKLSNLWRIADNEIGFMLGIRRSRNLCIQDAAQVLRLRREYGVSYL